MITGYTEGTKKEEAKKALKSLSLVTRWMVSVSLIQCRKPHWRKGATREFGLGNVGLV